MNGTKNGARGATPVGIDPPIYTALQRRARTNGTTITHETNVLLGKAVGINVEVFQTVVRRAGSSG